jgi:LPXTG-motif cell wall-anchored protein
MLVLGLAFVGAPLAQTTTVETRNFEVIAVDGNKLVVRDERGTNELTVPQDFRFTVDGKSMAVSDLKPGMKGQATVTTTTTVKPVVITEVKEGEVLRASSVSVTVRGADGQTRRFTQGELDQRGIQIVKDGRPVRVADLRRGDKLSATIVTAGAPVVLTAQEVEATLVEAKADAAATAVADATKQASQSAATTTASAKMGASDAAAKTGEVAGLSTTWWVLIAILVALAIYFFMRRKKEP